MAAYRASHTATVLSDGRVLLAGGNGTDTTLEIFDPETDTFTTVAGSLKMPRRGHTATLLPSGDVLIMGGGDRSAEVYDVGRDFARWAIGYPLWDRKDHTADTLSDGGLNMAVLLDIWRI